MKTDIYNYVKQCKLCQKQNITPVKYVTGQFSAPMAPIEFISMDLIGDFTPSSKGNKYALTVICMLTGYTFCIPIPSKKAPEVITAYIEGVYLEAQRKSSQTMDQNLKTNYLKKLLKN